MKGFWGNVAATVCAAALIANVAMLWSFSERLTKIESRLEWMGNSHSFTKDTQSANNPVNFR